MTTPLVMLAIAAASWSAGGPTTGVVDLRCSVVPSSGVALWIDDDGQATYTVHVNGYRTGADAARWERSYVSIGERPSAYATLALDGLRVTTTQAPMIVARTTE